MLRFKGSATAIEDAGRLMSIPFIISSICFPVFGLIRDHFGYQLTLLTTAGCCLVAAHVCSMTVYPVGPLILLGLSYSLFGALVWATVAHLVKSRNLGTAYGIQTSLVNLGMTITPLLIAFILASTGSYRFTLALLVVFGSIAVLLVLKLILDDKKMHCKGPPTINERSQ